MQDASEAIPIKSAPILLEAVNISKRLQGRQLLDHVDFRITRNEIVTLIGPNGCGKTTLLKCLLGLMRPDGGKIRRRRGLRIGYVPQMLHFDANFPLTVKAFLKLAHPRPYGMTDIFKLTGIHTLMEQQMRDLSGGERQRVLLAQALMGNPELLVLDEPVQGVDFNGQAQLYRLIRTASHQRQCAVLMVSHDLHLVMADTDRVLCLNGHICCSGAPHSVSRDPAFVKLFGEETARQVALYTHHHDHTHDSDGEVLPKRHAGQAE